MPVRITVNCACSVSIRIDRATRVEVDASGMVRIEVDDDLDDGAFAPRGATKRERRRAIAARLASGANVTPEMEAAAVSAFLAGADVARLGRALADVYAAMEAVRRRQDPLEEKDGPADP